MNLELFNELKNDVDIEFKLLARTILVKMRKLFTENNSELNESEYLYIEENDSSFKLSFLIPTKVKLHDINDIDPNVMARDLINSTLRFVRREFKFIQGVRVKECNLQYTGYSISPFGFVLEMAKNSLLPVKLRKISAEILASFSLADLKQQVSNDNNKNHSLPNDLIFAALWKRKEVAQRFIIANDEFDLLEINRQINNVKSLLNESMLERNLVAS